MSFFEELKRRNVVRMAVLYGVAGWLILQVCDVLFDQPDVPAWAFRLVLILLGIGFPFALISGTREALKPTSSTASPCFSRGMPKKDLNSSLPAQHSIRSRWKHTRGSPASTCNSCQFAQVYAQWGETQKALEWLRKAQALRDPGLLTVKVDRMIDPVRSVPEFQAILQEIGLADCCEVMDKSP